MAFSAMSKLLLLKSLKRNPLIFYRAVPIRNHNNSNFINNFISSLRSISAYLSSNNGGNDDDDGDDNDDHDVDGGDDYDGRGDHRSALYRCLLGIGDAPVRNAPPRSMRPWEPPKHGWLKLDFYISLPRDFYDEGRTRGGGLGGFQAIARNSAGDFIGITYGWKKFASKMGLQLYGLKASVILAKVLKDRGYHHGPVVYESTEILGTICFHERNTGQPAEVLQAFMPKDVNKLGKYCRTHVGDIEEVLAGVESELPGLRELIRQDKINAGLA